MGWRWWLGRRGYGVGAVVLYHLGTTLRGGGGGGESKFCCVCLQAVQNGRMPGRLDKKALYCCDKKKKKKSFQRRVCGAMYIYIYMNAHLPAGVRQEVLAVKILAHDTPFLLDVHPSEVNLFFLEESSHTHAGTQGRRRRRQTMQHHLQKHRRETSRVKQNYRRKKDRQSV